jgi:hypothetical protein
VFVLRLLGLEPGERVAASVVPWKGVQRAREDRRRAHAAHFASDGRACAAEQLAESHGGPHDLVLLAVPPGKGEAVVRAVGREVEVKVGA